MKTNRFNPCAIAAIAAFGFTSVSQAVVLAAYNFTAASAVSSTTGTGVTAGNFLAVIGADEGNIEADAGFSGGGTTFLRSDATGTTQANALADDDYFSVTIAATNVGEVLNLTTLTLTLGGSSDRAPAVTNNNQIYLLSSVDSFGSVISGTNTTSSFIGGTTAVPYDMNAVGSTSFDLSGASYQGLSSVTFQFRLSDDGSLNGIINRFDDVTFNGTVAAAVPEPSAAVIGGFGLLALLRRRRN